MSKSATRKQNAYKRLEAQLKSGVKPARDSRGKTTTQTVPLTDHDIARIKRELESLKYFKPVE